MKVQEGLFYSEEHEWVKVDGDKAYIGITDYAQKKLGSIVFIDMPEEDDEFDKGESFAAVESTKAASDVIMPIDSTIIKANEALDDEPGLVNENAYENWLALVTINDESQLENLLSAKEYEDYCSREG